MSKRTHICTECGSEFSNYFDGSAFCSRTCWKQSVRKTKDCSFCGAAIEKPTPTQQFCTRQCHYVGKKELNKQRLTFELLVEANNLPDQETKLFFLRTKTGCGVETLYEYMKEIGYVFSVPRVPRKATSSTASKLRSSNPACVICGESRAVDLAHIVSAESGGWVADSNIVGLCPTHHRLFDTGELDQEESENLEYTFYKKFRSLYTESR